MIRLSAIIRNPATRYRYRRPPHAAVHHPTPAKPCGDPAQAVQIPHKILDGDFLGRDAKGHAYILLKVQGWALDDLLAWSADAPDCEDNADCEEKNCRTR